MDAFAALADPVRRSLLLHLAAGPARVVDLAADARISRPAISKHLRVLAEAGLVAAERRGRERHYRLEATGLHPVAELLDRLGGAEEQVVPAPFGPDVLDALDLEVRRVGRDRRAAAAPSTLQEETA